MPFPNVPKEKTADVDRCVQHLMDDPDFKPRKGRSKKSSAVAVCISSIRDKGKMDKTTFEFKPEDEIDSLAKGTLLKGVELLRTGTFRGKKWGKEQLEKLVETFKALKKEADFDPPVRIGHYLPDNPVENAKSVVGYIEDLYVEEKGDDAVLKSDMDITEAEGLRKIKEGTLRKRSVEFAPYETNDGKVYEMALWGAGFVDIPQVEKLAEVNVFEKPLEEKKDELTKEEAVKNFEEAKTLSAEPDPEKYDAHKKGRIKKVMSLMEQMLQGSVKDKNYFDVHEATSILERLKAMHGREAFLEEQETDALTKKDGAPEMVSLEKSRLEELETLEKEMKEQELAARKSYVEDLVAKAKIPQGFLEKEIAFVQELSKELFASYKERHDAMPPLVELSKEQGNTSSPDPATGGQADRKELVEQAVARVRDFLYREGWKEERIEAYLKSKEGQIIL